MKSIRVLIVDDEKAEWETRIRSAIESVFGAREVDIDFEDHFDVGSQRAKEGRYDVVVFDLLFQNDGSVDIAEVQKWLLGFRKGGKAALVVVCSQLDAEGNECVESGAADLFVPKKNCRLWEDAEGPWRELPKRLEEESGGGDIQTASFFGQLLTRVIFFLRDGERGSDWVPGEV